MKDCAALSGEDIITLKEMGEALLHPKSLIFNDAINVVVNGVSIFKDVKAGIADLNSAKYEEAGKEFGEIAAMVLFGSFAQDSTFLQ